MHLEFSANMSVFMYLKLEILIAVSCCFLQEVHELLSNYDLKYCFVDKYKGTGMYFILLFVMSLICYATPGYLLCFQNIAQYFPIQ